MVEWRADFLLLFEGNRTGNKKEFLELLSHRLGDEIRVFNKQTDQGVELGMKTEGGAEPSYMPFYLNAGPFPVGRDSQLYSASGLYFYTDLMSDSHEPEQ